MASGPNPLTSCGCGRVEGGQQVLGDGLDKPLGVVVLVEGGEARRGGLAPVDEALGRSLVEGSEFRVAEDGGLEFGGRWLEAGIARTQGVEERRPQAGHHLPVGIQRVQVALWNAAVQVGVDVLDVFRFGTVDITRDIQVVVVPLNFREADHT